MAADHAGGREPLFEHLLACRPVRERRSRASATAGAVAVHGVLIGAVAWATVAAASRRPSPAMVDDVVYLELVPPTLIVPAAPVHTARAARPERRPRAEERPSRAEREAAARRRGRAAERRLERLVARMAPAGVPSEIPAPTPVQFAFSEPDYGEVATERTGATAAEILAENTGPTVEELAAGEPRFTPYTVPPELMNRDEIRRALLREYPVALQEMGVGGQVLMWFLIDESGHAMRWLLKQSSGNRRLDKAALKVASRMRFTPAFSYDHRVPVWVVMPITFRVEMAG